MLGCDQAGGVERAGGVDLGDQGDGAVGEVAAKARGTAYDVVAIGGSPAQLLEEAAANFAHDLVASIRDGDLGEGRKRRGSEHLREVDGHERRSVAIDRESHRVADGLLAGANGVLRLDSVGRGRRVAPKAPRVLACESVERHLIGRRRGDAPGGEHDRNRPTRLLGGQLGDSAEPIPGEQGGEHSGVEVSHPVVGGA